MNRINKLLLLAAAGSACVASAQVPSLSPLAANSALATSTPTAYVYVSATMSTGTNGIYAFAAGPNGALTLVAGSPFHDDVTYMAVNGKYLFGSTRSGLYVASFLIEPNGAPHWNNSTNVANLNMSGCTYASPLVLDHTGTGIYRSALDGSLCESSEYQTFHVDATTGRLSYQASSAVKFLYSTPLTFSASNAYAYGSDCINYKGSYLDTFQIFSRLSNGFLNDTAISTAPPPPRTSSEFYCRSLPAADPANHVAVVVQSIDTSSSTPVGAPQLAVYTRNTNGSLATTSTAANMPPTSVGSVFGTAMSPDGKLLAVSGAAGVQVFHFNGSAPISPYTGLLTTAGAEQIFWDNAHHLYAISRNAQKLYVFSVTATRVSQASGSPYTISQPQNLIVQPKTPIQ